MIQSRKSDLQTQSGVSVAARLFVAVHRSRIGKGYLTDVIAPLAISTLLKPIRQPSGTILTLSEVRRQVVVNALDKCGGNYLLAAHLLGIGKATI